MFSAFVVVELYQVQARRSFVGKNGCETAKAACDPFLWHPKWGVTVNMVLPRRPMSDSRSTAAENLGKVLHRDQITAEYAY